MHVKFLNSTNFKTYLNRNIDECCILFTCRTKNGLRFSV